MRVRQLSPTGGMMFGRGQQDFLRDVPEAVAQCVQTRLGEYVGDWYLDKTAGTPWRTQVLGRRTESTRDPAMRARILGTQGVAGIQTYASQVNRSVRGFTFQATIDTIYGEAQVDTSAPSQTIDVRQGR